MYSAFQLSNISFSHTISFLISLPVSLLISPFFLYPLSFSSQAQTLFRRLDTTKSNSVDYKDFLSKFADMISKRKGGGGGSSTSVGAFAGRNRPASASGALSPRSPYTAASPVIPDRGGGRGKDPYFDPRDSYGASPYHGGRDGYGRDPYARDSYGGGGGFGRNSLSDSTSSFIPSSSAAAANQPDPLSELVDLVRSSLMTCFHSLKEAFLAMDAAGTGRISPRDLWDGLRRAGVYEARAHEFMRYSNIERIGSLDYADFLRLVLCTITGEAGHRVRSTVGKRHDDLLAAFQAEDKEVKGGEGFRLRR